jgi:energy-converting hydrogenase Eha subunit C
MLLRIFIAVIIIAAILFGAVVLILQRDQLVKIIMFRDFFDAALPILAFGALIKYLCTFKHHH